MNLHPDDHVIAITRTPPLTVGASATLRQAAEALATANVGALVVPPGNGHPLAIISERDVVRALAHGANPDEVWAADVMTEEPRYATTGQSIRSVAEEMLSTGVRHILVMDEGEVIGVVGVRDVLRVLTAESAPAVFSPLHQ